MDFAELYKRHECTIQVGGQDQWGNIVGGIDLTRRQHSAKAFGLTVPLITNLTAPSSQKPKVARSWILRRLPSTPSTSSDEHRRCGCL